MIPPHNLSQIRIFQRVLCYVARFSIKQFSSSILMASSSSSSSCDAPLSSKTLSQPLLVLPCPGGDFSCASNNDARGGMAQVVELLI